MHTRQPTQGDRDLVAALQLARKAKESLAKRTPDARREGLDGLATALGIFKRLGDRYQQILTLSSMGAALVDSGDYPRALQTAAEGAGLAKQYGDRGMEANALNLQGGMLDLLGDPGKALALYEEALAIFREAGEPTRESIVLNNIGKIHGDFGDWTKALEYYEKGIALARRQGESAREATFLQNAGNSRVVLGDAEQAEEMFNRGLEIRRARKDKAGEAESLRALGGLAVTRNQTTTALERLRQALRLYIALGDSANESEVQRMMGLAVAQTGDFGQAETLLRRALEGERTMNRRRTASMARLDLGSVLQRAGRPAEALAEAQQTLLEARVIGDQSLEARSLELMARSEDGLGRIKEAVHNANESLLVMEAIRGKAASQDLRASFLATRQNAWELAVDLLMRSGKTDSKLQEQALETSERFHARSLLEMLVESGADIRTGADPALLEREREISNRLNARGARLLPLLGSTSPAAQTLRKEVLNLEAEYRDVQAEIRRASPHYAAITQPEPLTLQKIQDEVLDERSLLLEYSLGEKRSYLWAVSRGGMQAWELPSRGKIEEQVDEVVGLLTARSTSPRLESQAGRAKRIAVADAALPAAARRLSETILGPAASVLSGKTLVVVPDGVLQRIPFSMLADPSSRPLRGAGEPLVAGHEIVMAPSASALAVLRRETLERKVAPK